jgi:hypothetical protein
MSIGCRDRRLYTAFLQLARLCSLATIGDRGRLWSLATTSVPGGRLRLLAPLGVHAFF